MKFPSIRAAIAALFLASASWNAAAQTADFRIVPLPNQVRTTQQAPFSLTAQTVIVYPKGNAEMQRNARFLADYLAQATGLQLKQTTKAKAGVSAIFLSADLQHKNPEAYRLSVTADGIRIQGASAAGAFYGIQTLRKAVAPAGKAERISVPAVEIADYPRFSYRGAHLDVSRHFVTKDSVLRFIDMLALHNINRMHWHITDDQGWRIEIKKYPRLTQVGSYRPETVIGHNSGKYDGRPHQGFYTQRDIREVVDYARQRHITIIPEIDLPGHMQAALAAYPHLGCTGGPYEVWKIWGVSDDVLCAGNDTVLRFIDDVLTEVAALFPSEYIHVGGDECPKTRWKSCPKCQARIQREGLQADGKHSAEERLQSYVIRHAAQHLASLGRKMIGWDETLEGGLAEGATVMSWRGEAGGVEAARLGHDVIMTPNTYLYFDYYQTANTAEEPEAIGGCLPLALVYSYDPLPKSLTPEQARHIIGVQANLWTEYMPTYRQMEYMELPRMAALCEIQWTEQAQRNYGDFRQRLPRFIQVYDQQGYNYAKHVFDVEAKYSLAPARHAIVADLATIDNAEIRYTLDGSEPTQQSARYNGPLDITRTAKLQARAFRPNTGASRLLQENFHFSKATGCAVTLLQQPHSQYTYDGPRMLTDGMWGEASPFNSGRWIAFSGTDLEAVIDLGTEMEVSRVGYNAHVLKSYWIMLDRGVEISLSCDGENYQSVYKEEKPAMQESDPDKVYTCMYTFPTARARFVKVKALSEHSLPSWHGAKGKEGFLFVDEIMVE